MNLPAGLSLAPMQQADVGAVLEIERRAYPFPWTEGILRDSLLAGYSSWIIRDAQGKVSAYALMSMAAGEAHILNLCVEPTRQRQGLGRLLLGHLKQVAAAAGTQLMLLEVRKSNAAAIALYLSGGFQRLGQRKAYYPAEGGAEDAWLLGLELKPESAAA